MIHSRHTHPGAARRRGSIQKPGRAVLKEVEELRRENEALRAQLASAETERQRLEVLVRTSPVGVLVVDAGTRTVVSVNQEAERIMGVPAGQQAGAVPESGRVPAPGRARVLH